VVLTSWARPIAISTGQTAPVPGFEEVGQYEISRGLTRMTRFLL
jgi:hypothetical protein